MYLKKLEMYGFKSFADKTNIEFDPGITAIVGPNGSGKSNVADAVRWVLGEQSAKSLRGSRMEDVIFSGTQQRKPLGFAEVSLTLDNSDNYLPVEFSEITITRRVFRSGESEYYINRSSCRLKDIVELFMDTGIGKEGYSIIGQGRIEEIINAHPENRREIFEEAAGIVKYKTRKEEAVRKLNKTLENIIRVDDILSEISRQLEPLEIQSRVAKEYLNLRDELKIYRLNQFIFKYDKYTENINQLKEQTALLEKDISDYKMAVKQEEIRYEAAKEEMNRIIAEIQNYRDICHELMQKMEKLKGEVGIIEERVQQILKEKQRLEAEIDHEEKQIEQKSKERDEAAVLLEKYQIDLSNAQKESAKLTEQMEKLQDCLSKRRSEVESKKNVIFNILNELSQIENEITRFRTMEANLLERENQILDELRSLKELETSFSEKKISIETKIETLKKEMKNQELKKKNLDEIAVKHKSAMENLQTSLQMKKQELEGLKSRLKVLEEMNKDYEGFQKSVKNILKECKKNLELKKRVCGVVAELIRVPHKYELAIETALGASLQHIVTENEEDAKYIIKFLKSRQWGRATFLPITAIKARTLTNAEKAVLQMEGCHGIASELINFDPKYMKIFQNILGRVVITENLDQAVNIARRFSYSFKIVTLEGDIINPGGAITGGSSNHRKNTGLIGRNREIGELKLQIAQVSDELKKEEEKKEIFYQEYKNILNELEMTTQKLHNLEIKQTANYEQKERVRQELLRISSQINKFKNDIGEIREKISSIRQSIKQKEEQAEKLKEQNTDLKIIAQGMESSIKEIIRQKEEMDKQATDKKIFIASIKREIAALEEKKEALSKELEQLKLSVEEKRKQVEIKSRKEEEYKENIFKKRENINEIQKIVSDKEECINEMQKQKDRQEINIKGIEKKRKELGETIERIIEQKHRIEVYLSKQEVELDNLQNSIWNEYEISYANALDFKDATLTPSKIERKIREIKDKMNNLGEINVNAIDEYKRVKERFDFLCNQKQDLLNAENNLRRVIKDITKTMEDRFIKEFKIINEYFNEVFCKLFGGGKAELILENSDNVLESGIEIVAQPPGKKLQNLSLMSGGEKTLTAIAILFAILKKKPTPFCVLDEIEAALDEANVHRFGNFIKEFSRNTQFVIITHRRETMENSDVLYGVTMEEKGVSRMISVKLEEAS